MSSPISPTQTLQSLETRVVELERKLYRGLSLGTESVAGDLDGILLRTVHTASSGAFTFEHNLGLGTYNNGDPNVTWMVLGFWSPMIPTSAPYLYRLTTDPPPTEDSIDLRLGGSWVGSLTLVTFFMARG